MSTFFSGALNPFWPHFWLLGGSLIAGFAVAIGIVLENPKWSLANILVVGGVAIEAVCTLLLFGFDEGISDVQQKDIVALEMRLTARTLSVSDQSEISKAVNVFAGQHFKLTEYWDDQESVDIGDQIGSALGSAGWLPIKPPTDAAVVGVIAGVVVYFDDQSSDSTKKAAKTLVDVLNAKHIATRLRAIRANDPDQLNVTVGIKP